MLITMLAICVIAYAGLLSALLFHLERRHPDIWAQVGSPRWFYLPGADSWELLKFLFAGGPRADLHPTVRLLVRGTRLALLLVVIVLMLLVLRRCSEPAPEELSMRQTSIAGSMKGDP